MKKINFTINHNSDYAPLNPDWDDLDTFELELDENGFGLQELWRIGDNYEITEGTATDAEGNILYQIEPVTITLGGTDRTHYEWVTSE